MPLEWAFYHVDSLRNQKAFVFQRPRSRDACVKSRSFLPFETEGEKEASDSKVFHFIKKVGWRELIRSSSSSSLPSHWAATRLTLQWPCPSLLPFSLSQCTIHALWVCAAPEEKKVRAKFCNDARQAKLASTFQMKQVFFSPWSVFRLKSFFSYLQPGRKRLPTVFLPRSSKVVCHLHISCMIYTYIPTLHELSWLIPRPCAQKSPEFWYCSVKYFIVMYSIVVLPTPLTNISRGVSHVTPRSLDGKRQTHLLH